MEKVCFSGLDVLKPYVNEPTKFPRTAIILVVKDQKTGYLNAAPYSGGVTSIKPLRVVFGIGVSASWFDMLRVFDEANEFCIAIPRREQVDHMWVMALNVPHGINEIEVAGWHTLPSGQIETPGIEECPLNLECKKIHLERIPAGFGNFGICNAEVVGVTIDTELLNMTRSEVLRLLPMYEAGVNPETGFYGPGIHTDELIPPAASAKIVHSKEKKTHVGGADLYRPENDKVLMNAIWPMPAYIVVSNDGKDNINALPICGGYLKSVQPRSAIPIPKNSTAYENIKKNGEFVVSIPDRDHIVDFEKLEKNSDDVATAGFSLLKPNVIDVPAIAECPVSQDCKTAAFWDVPGTEYAILMGWQVGITLDREIEIKYNPDFNPYHDRNAYLNQLYSRYFSAVMDRGMVRKWGFQDVNNLTVRGYPSWGSRYHGAWWGSGLDYWLIELCDEGLITRQEYFKIRYAITQWNNAMGKNTVPFVANYYTDVMKRDLQKRLTTLFGMMAWAHRDLKKWDQVHEYLGQFPEAHLDFHFGPMHAEKWWEQKV